MDKLEFLEVPLKEKRDRIRKFMELEYQALKNEINQLRNIQIALLVGTISASGLLFTLIFSRIDAVKEESLKLAEIASEIRNSNFNDIFINISEKLNNLSSNGNINWLLENNQSLHQINETILNLSFQLQKCLDLSSQKPLELFVLLPLAIILPSTIIFFHNFELINKKLAYCKNLESYLLKNKNIENYNGYENYREKYYVKTETITPLVSKFLEKETDDNNASIFKYLEKIIFVDKSLRFEITAFFTYIGLFIIDFFILSYNRLDKNYLYFFGSEYWTFDGIIIFAAIIMMFTGIGLIFQKESKFWLYMSIVIPTALFSFQIFLLLNSIKTDIIKFVVMDVFYLITAAYMAILYAILIIMTLDITLKKLSDKGIIKKNIPQILEKIEVIISIKNLRNINVLSILVILILINPTIIFVNYSIVGLVLYFSIISSLAVLIWAFLKIWSLNGGYESIELLRTKWEEIINDDNFDEEKKNEDLKKLGRNLENDNIDAKADDEKKNGDVKELGDNLENNNIDDIADKEKDDENANNLRDIEK